MTGIFAVCAVFGGTVLVIQFLLTLVGLGGHSADGDVPQDVGHDLGGGMADDVGGDFHGDTGGADYHGHAGDDAHHHGHGDHGSSWLFRALSFRTIIAALAFFGLAGLAAQAAELSDMNAFLVALAAGVAAMYGVYWLLRSLCGIRSEGTVRVQAAIGRSGTVYVPVPGHNAGAGKIQLNLQNRTMEYMAVTPGEHLPTGAKVVVTDVVTSDTLEVQPVLAAERNDHE